MCTAHVLMQFCHLINRSFVCKAKGGRHIGIRFILTRLFYSMGINVFVVMIHTAILLHFLKLKRLTAIMDVQEILYRSVAECIDCQYTVQVRITNCIDNTALLDCILLVIYWQCRVARLYLRILVIYRQCRVARLYLRILVIYWQCRIARLYLRILVIYWQCRVARLHLRILVIYWQFRVARMYVRILVIY